MSNPFEKFEESIMSFLNAWEEATGKPPQALLLGPREYLTLCLAMEHTGRTLKGSTTPDGKHQLEALQSYRGIPVRIKQSSGLEAELTHAQVAASAFKQARAEDRV